MKKKKKKKKRSYFHTHISLMLTFQLVGPEPNGKMVSCSFL